MTNPESQTRSEEMQVKAEAMVLGVFAAADFPAAAKVMSDALGLSTLLTAEANNITLKEVLLRYQNAARTGTATELMLSAHETESWRQLAKDAERERDKLEVVNQQYHASEVNLLKERDQLRAELARIHDCFPASSRPASTDVMTMKAAVQKMQAELATAKAELEKWKLGCETSADCYKTAVREQDNQRLELLKLKAENAALRDVALVASEHRRYSMDHLTPDSCPICVSIRTLAEKGIVLDAKALAAKEGK